MISFKATKSRSKTRFSTSFPFTVFLTFILLALSSLSAAAAEKEIYEHWAPVLYHAAATEADFITKADYDGDWIGSNNWDNFGKYPLPAYGYYDVKETDTHWFLYYAFFHPRDYIEDPACQRSCHENDLEALQLIVRKDGSQYGDLEAMETLYHSSLGLYSNKDYIKGGHLKVLSGITFTKGLPTVYVERYGHGIYGTPLGSLEANPDFTDTVRYIYLGKAEVPEGIPDSKVSYDLLPVRDTFWPHRDCVGNGECFDALFDYRGVKLPAQIDGDDYGTDSANVPWGSNQGAGGDIKRGDWFFDPARAFLFHAGPVENFSTDYTFNPYLEELEKIAEQDD